MVEEVSAQKALLKGGGPGAGLPTFLDAVKKCLARRIIEFEVDLTGHEADLEALVPALVKLQEMVGARGKALTIRGIPEGTPAHARLREAGAEVRGGAKTMRWTAVTLKALLEKTSEDAKLPDFSEFDAEFEQAREQLKSLLLGEESLNRELTEMKARTQLLSKGLNFSAKSLSDLEELNALEMELVQKRSLIPEYRRQMTEVKDKAAEAQKAYQEFVKRADQENQKKLEGLKKNLAGLVSDFEKRKAEFEKRSEARRAELKKRGESQGSGS